MAVFQNGDPQARAQNVIIIHMGIFRRPILAITLLLAACRPSTPEYIRVLDGAEILDMGADSRLPSELFIRAGRILGPEDEALLDGVPIRMDEPLTVTAGHILQIRRAINLILVTPEGSESIQSTAPTIGQALQEAGLSLHVSDFIDPPPDTPLTGPVTVNYLPSRQLEVRSTSGSVQVRSTASTIGEVLADTGFPLQGLDYSRPRLADSPPNGSLIEVVRVSESLILAQNQIPFESKFQASAEVPLDQQQILHPGQSGLSMNRIRIRYEDGLEISRQIEAGSLIRPPENRVVGYGTRVEVKSAQVNGVQIEYWRAVQMYATSYSPCRSGTDRCYSNTASGKPVKKGVVALRTDLYLGMRGQALFIPGYGFASVEDACGGCTGKPWIDLGYSDTDYQQWGSWVTVYFLAPIPANILYVLE